MGRRVWRGPIGLLAGLVLAAGLGVGAAVLTRGAPATAIPAFASHQDMADFLEARKAKVERLLAGMPYADDALMMEVAAPADAAATAAPDTPATEAGVTNVQEVGVDEGGLIKARGDLLIVLRRGRLFSLSTAGGGLRAVDRIDAFPPGTDIRDAAVSAWYDEMLVVGDRVVVIGYDYGLTPEQGGTRVVRFHLSPQGDLDFEDAYQLKSFDYYSSENFASRLIGNTLVLYAPLPLDVGRDGPVVPEALMPGLRALGPKTLQPFRPIARPSDVHIAPHIRADPEQADTLHAVTRCDLNSTPMRCQATGVIASWSRSFYVSRDALYLWTAGWAEHGPFGLQRASPPASVYRLPLDGGEPTAIQARGAPKDQFSFRERDGALDVVVQDEGRGDAMWAGSATRGRTRLVHLPLERFGDGSTIAGARDYRDLPVPTASWRRQVRFVGDHVLVASTNGEDDGDGGVLVVAPVRGGEATALAFDRPISRLEPLGRDALAVTSGRGTGINLIRLEGTPRVTMRMEIGGQGEAESRSHGFFFRADPGSAGQTGMMALPVVRALASAADSVVGEAVDMIFVRRDGERLYRAGALGGQVGRADDDCVVSCVDWYGDARPVFLGTRMFALLGYELVEGREQNRRVVEVRRLDFSPPSSSAPG